MDEGEWLSSSDPLEMLSFVEDREAFPERKARLFLVAVCRRIFDLLPDPRSTEAIEAAERFADGAACEAELAVARAGAEACGLGLRAWEPLTEAAHAAENACSPVASDAAFTASLDAKQARATAGGGGWDAGLWRAEEEAQADLIRDLCGDPFRPVPAIDPAWLAWGGGLVGRLAEAAYEGRVMPGGTLDRERLAVLADALEEAGADAALIEHLRGPGPHYRGCFVIDILTGRG